MANVPYTDANGVIRFSHSTKTGDNSVPDLSPEDVINELVPSATIYTGTLVLSTGAVAISASQACREVLVQNDPNNTVDILVGNSSGQSLRLQPGQAFEIRVANISMIYAKSASGTPTLNWVARS